MAGKNRTDPYNQNKVPPCSAFLGNKEPIIKDGKLLFRNENRVYYFISAVRDPATNQEPPGLEGTSPITDKPFISFNLQVSSSTFLIGVFINEVQRGRIPYHEGMQIHADKAVNEWIHGMLKKSTSTKTEVIPELAVIISNENAILPIFTYSINITVLNFFILLMINRIEGDPGFYFGNNSFVTGDSVNFTLADLVIWFSE